MPWTSGHCRPEGFPANKNRAACGHAVALREPYRAPAQELHQKLAGWHWRVALCCSRKQPGIAPVGVTISIPVTAPVIRRSSTRCWAPQVLLRGQKNQDLRAPESHYRCCMSLGRPVAVPYDTLGLSSASKGPAKSRLEGPRIALCLLHQLVAISTTRWALQVPLRGQKKQDLRAPESHYVCCISLGRPVAVPYDTFGPSIKFQ